VSIDPRVDIGHVHLKVSDIDRALAFYRDILGFDVMQQQGLTQDDYSVTGGVIAVTTIALVQVGSSYLSFRSRRARKVLEGEPIVIIQDGELIEKNLRRERMTADEVAEEMRMQQVASFDEVQWAIVESNGQISFVKK
jgi:uncharacterized membrane protein YcaP (DUF421 family)